MKVIEVGAWTEWDHRGWGEERMRRSQRLGCRRNGGHRGWGGNRMGVTKAEEVWKEWESKRLKKYGKDGGHRG